MGLGIIFSLKAAAIALVLILIGVFFPIIFHSELIRNKMSLPEIIQGDMESICGGNKGGGLFSLYSAILVVYSSAPCGSRVANM